MATPRRTLAPLTCVALALCALQLACAASRLATAGRESALGSELAQEVEASVGLADHASAAEYVARVGARLVASSDSVRDGLTYQFKVIDLEAPNAFALPGGHIYVSRGLLALLQTEDELANVLAHEIAHVSARHHLRHALRQTTFVPVRLATGIGAVATGIVSPLLGRAVATLGRAPTALVLATYSRSQENEADELGQGFAAAAGWQPLAMSRVMETLARDERQRGGDPSRRSYFATHPPSPDRAEQTARRAEALAVADTAPIAVDRRGFLQRLDGLPVGTPAREGVIAGREYLHPTLGFHLTFPAGWTIRQDDHAVRAVPEDEDAMALLTVFGKGDATDQAARSFFEDTPFELEAGPVTRWTEEVAATYAVARYKADGKHYRYALAWIAHGERIYQVSAGAYLHTWAVREDELDRVAKSFRPLTSADAPKLREGRLRVVAAPDGTLASHMPGASAWTVEQAAVANALDGDDLPADGWLKVAPLERWQDSDGPDAAD